MAEQSVPFFAVAAVVVLLLAFGSLAVAASRLTAITWDEPTYMGGGYYYLKTGDSRMVVGLPLNTMILAGLPLLVFNPTLPQNAESYVNVSYVKFGHDFLFSGGVDPDRLVFFSRLPFVAVSLLLCVLVFLWAKELYGYRAGLFALFLAVFSTTLLAHSFIVLADVLLTTFGFGSMFFFWKFLGSRAPRHLLLAAIFFGLAMNSKLNAVLFLPVYLCLFALVFIYRKLPSVKLVFRLFSRPGLVEYTRSFFLVLVLFGVVSAAIIFVSYRFQFTSLSNAVPQSYIQRGQEVLAEGAGPYAKFAPIINKLITLPLPFPTYFGGFAVQSFVSSHAIKRSYLFGHVYTGGKWYYYFVEFFLKTQLPLLILLGFSLALMVKGEGRTFDELFLLVPPVVYFLLFIPNTVNAGIRHLLFVYPFIFVMVSRLVTLRVQQLYRQFFRFSIVALCVWYALGALLIFPHFMAYFNELVGGLAHGHQYLVADNLDIGQDLKGLRAWMGERGVQRIRLSYFGTADPAYYGIPYDYLPSPVWEPWVPDYVPLETMLPSSYQQDCSPQTGLIAISASNLHSVFLLNQSCFNWLLDKKPIATIGYSIFVYNVTENAGGIGYE